MLRLLQHSLHKRTLATVVTGNASHPLAPPKPPAVSADRATFTIRNGPIFHGHSFGAKRNVSGEAVFTTSLVGYPESMTDPSYRGQLLVFTQPLIGNYGVPSSSARDEFNLLKFFESPNIQCSGIIVADSALRYSHWTAVESLGEWCTREGIAAVSGVDTRAIVTYLREQGSSLAKINVGEEYDADDDEAFIDPAGVNLVSRVSTLQPFHIDCGGDTHVAVIDCGVKENILRCLARRGINSTVFPFDYPVHQIAHLFDGIFISNGPGDPTHCTKTIETLRRLLESYEGPIMGICLGHQLLALAAGAKTIKMKYGNRAHNIGVKNVVSGECYITSQNHGYAVDASTLPPDWKPLFINLNDGSNEGMFHSTRPILSTQFHPEAKGGPQDSAPLFDAYLENIRKYKNLNPEKYKMFVGNSFLADVKARERVFALVS